MSVWDSPILRLGIINFFLIFNYFGSLMVLENLEDQLLLWFGKKVRISQGFSRAQIKGRTKGTRLVIEAQKGRWGFREGSS